MKNATDVLMSRLDMAEERTFEPEEMTMKTSIKMCGRQQQ